MSAGLRGAERVRSVTREECGGPMLCVCRLLGTDTDAFSTAPFSLMQRCSDAGIDVPEHLTRIAMFRVDEGFRLGVAICGYHAWTFNNGIGLVMIDC